MRALVVAEDLEDCHRVLALARERPDFVVPALGVHPDRASEVSDAEVAAVVDLVRVHAASLGAVGEVGLDFRPRWDERARARQAEVFGTMIRLAADLRLPLSVHSRSAGRHALAMLEERAAGAACLHAFDGRAAHAVRGVAGGRVFSVPPSIVRSQGKQELVRRLPASALLLESDSPVLGPRPEERNEPANVALALQEIARLRGEDSFALAAAIRDTVARTFPRLAS